MFFGFGASDFNIAKMKEDKEKVGRDSVRRGSDLKIIEAPLFR